MTWLRKNPLTKISFLLIAVYVISTVVNYEDWKDDYKVIEADVKGYYAYLPALFIHNDLAFENVEVYKKGENDMHIWVQVDDQGRKQIKYSYGMALLYSPFFLSSHAYAKLTGQEANGYSEPYRFGLMICSFVFLLIGLIAMSRFLLLHFEDHIVAICLIILYLGTNLFNYYTDEYAMSHGYSFALIASLFLTAHHWLEKATIGRSLLIGLLAGIVVLIRPIDIIFLLFFGLYKVGSMNDLKERVSLLISRWGKLLIIALIAFLVMLPQFLYLKFAYGSFTSYSYSDEGFFFLSPNLWDTVFSYRNGWLIYSPIMVFSIIGFFFMKGRTNKRLLFVAVVSLLYYYVISSWWCWWYSGFGNRAFINMYPVLAIPLGAMIGYITKKGWLVKTSFYSMAILAIVLSLHQSEKYRYGFLHWTAMTKEAYWAGFGYSNPHPFYEYQQRHPDYTLAKQGIDAVYVPVTDTLQSTYINFEKTRLSGLLDPKLIRDKSGRNNSHSYHIPKKTVYGLNYTFMADSADHVHAYFWYNGEEDVNLMLSTKGGQPFYFGKHFPVERSNGWTKVGIFSPIPKEFAQDTLLLYLVKEHLCPFDSSFELDDFELHLTNESKILEYQ